MKPFEPRPGTTLSGRACTVLSRTLGAVIVRYEDVPWPRYECLAEEYIRFEEKKCALADLNG